MDFLVMSHCSREFLWHHCTYINMLNKNNLEAIKKVQSSRVETIGMIQIN